MITEKASDVMNIILNHLRNLSGAWVGDTVYSQVELLARLPNISETETCFPRHGGYYESSLCSQACILPLQVSRTASLAPPWPSPGLWEGWSS